MKCVCIQYIISVARLVRAAGGKSPLRRTLHLTFMPDEEVGGRFLASFRASSFHFRRLFGNGEIRRNTGIQGLEPWLCIRRRLGQRDGQVHGVLRRAWHLVDESPRGWANRTWLPFRGRYCNGKADDLCQPHAGVPKAAGGTVGGSWPRMHSCRSALWALAAIADR